MIPLFIQTIYSSMVYAGQTSIRVKEVEETGWRCQVTHKRTHFSSNIDVDPRVHLTAV